MATTRILLTPEDAVLPTANPAALTKTLSAGTPPANAPAITYNVLAFNDTTDQTCSWAFRLPSDYLSGGLIVVQWYAVAVAGNVVLKAGIAPVRLNNDDLDTTLAYNGPNLSGTVAVPGTSGRLLETSWALTMTNVAPGLPVSIFLGRDADNAADTAVGNLNVFTVEFEYTS